jgi:hypothetical protein
MPALRQTPEMTNTGGEPRKLFATIVPEENDEPRDLP